MNNFKKNIFKTFIEEDIPVESYCVIWEAHNEGNIKMSTTGFLDFTDILAGRTILDSPMSVGTITGYIIAGLGTFPCSIPMTFTTSTADWGTNTLPVKIDKVLTSLIYSVEIIFNNASEYSIVDGQTNAIVEEGIQIDAYYNSCT